MSGVYFDNFDSDDDMRFVYRQETFDDLAIRELAKSRAMCMCRLQFGRCTLKDCDRCNTWLRFKECHNQLDDYNRTRISNYITRYYTRFSSTPEIWMSYRRLVRHVLTWLAMLFFVIALMAGFIFYVDRWPQASPSGGIPKDLDQKIVYCMKYAQQRVYDRNLDQKVNCIDYTITFKEQWDAMYPKQKSICFIIRNKSSHYKKFHHLFIGIYYMGGYIFVEPWAADPERYLMIENWDRRYDPKYNIYGETEKWMKEKIW